MKAGGYTLHDVDLYAAGAEELLLRPESDAAGMGCILRKDAAIIGYKLFDAKDVPANGFSANDLLTEDVQMVSKYVDIRKRLSEQHDCPAPVISVVICTKDRPDWLRRLLASLAAQNTQRSFEIVVVDNNSDSTEVRSVAEEAGVVYVCERKTGLNFARNRAIATATGDIVAFLDDDTTAEPDWFDNLSHVWAQNPDAGCVTGLVLPMSLETQAQVAFEKDGGFRRALLPDRHTKIGWRRPLHPCGAGEFGAGANMSVDRQYVLSLGGFDEALDTGRPLPGGGDLDIFYRVIRGGRTLVYEPGVVVRHDHRREMKVLKHQYYTWGLGFFAYLQKSKRSDPDNAHDLTQMGRWTWVYLGRRLFGSIFGLENRAAGMIAAELRGAIKGRFGEYQRSQKRSQVIRETVGE